jgi:hypothetical protein
MATAKGLLKQVDQEPYISAVVQYFDNNAKCQPAIITSISRVPGQQVVCLQVWFDGGRTNWVKDCLYSKVPGVPGTWTWARKES